MATHKLPIKAMRVGGYTYGLGEFAAGDLAPVEHGGTGLGALGTADQLLGVTADGTTMEYKTIAVIGGVLTQNPGVITFDVVNTNQIGNNRINTFLGVK